MIRKRRPRAGDRPGAGSRGVGGLRAQWNRTIVGLFAIVAVALVACLAAEAMLLSSLGETARGIEQSNTGISTLQGDNAVYAGYVPRYLDGQIDHARVSARAKVESDFRSAVQHVHGAAGRRLVEQAHQQWLANDASRGALSPSTSATERLQQYAAITSSDNAVMAITDGRRRRPAPTFTTTSHASSARRGSSPPGSWCRASEVRLRVAWGRISSAVLVRWRGGSGRSSRR